MARKKVGHIAPWAGGQGIRKVAVTKKAEKKGQITQIVLPNLQQIHFWGAREEIQKEKLGVNQKTP